MRQEDHKFEAIEGYTLRTCEKQLQQKIYFNLTPITCNIVWHMTLNSKWLCKYQHIFSKCLFVLFLFLSSFIFETGSVCYPGRPGTCMFETRLVSYSKRFICLPRPWVLGLKLCTTTSGCRCVFFKSPLSKCFVIGTSLLGGETIPFHLPCSLHICFWKTLLLPFSLT